MIMERFGLGVQSKRQLHWSRILYVAGLLALVASLQAWFFEHQLENRVETSFDQLTALQLEAASNREVNAALSGLQEYWRLTRDDNDKRAVLTLRDSVVAGFHANPVETIEEISNVVSALPANSNSLEEALHRVQRNVNSLLQLYGDHSDSAVRFFSAPPWYLQPTASFLAEKPSTGQALHFNHALYLMHAKELARADELLHSMRPSKDNSTLDSRRLFALARLQFAQFETSNDPAPLADTLQYTRQSVQADANFKLAKLFLAYLLSIDVQSVRVDAPTEEGEGSGMGEGERGAINNDTGEF